MTHISKHYSYVSNVNEFPSLDGQTEVGPAYYLEYSTRDAYGGNITWGVDDPLNATWWHLVTERLSPLSYLLEPTIILMMILSQKWSSILPWSR
jgi:sphingomyelin phosphodiesterase